MPRLVAALVLTCGLLAGPAAAVAAGPPGTGAVRVVEVTGREHTGRHGTKVVLDVDLRNRTSTSASRHPLEIYLVGRDRTVGFGRLNTPAVPAGESRHVHYVAGLEPKTVPGSYAVAVCLVFDAERYCRTSDGRLVQIRPAALSVDPTALEVPASSTRTLTVSSSGGSWTGRVKVELADPGLSWSSTCGELPHGLPPGATCEVTVQALPGAGPRTASLTVSARRAAPVTVLVGTPG